MSSSNAPTGAGDAAHPSGAGDNAFGVTNNSNLQQARLDYAVNSVKESWGHMTGTENPEAGAKKEAAKEAIKAHGTHREVHEIEKNQTK